MIFSGPVPLLENRDLGHGNYLAVLDAPDVGRRLQPAQFVMLRPRQGSDPLLGRPFSVAGVGQGPHGPTVEILYKVVGRGTGLLAGLVPGAAVAMVGPLGRPFPDPPAADSPVLLVAGGIGIAPFPLHAARLTAAGFAPTLLYGARSRNDLVGRELFPGGMDMALASDDGSAGHHGLVTELLDRRLAGMTPAARRRAVAYVCGPTPMMAAADAVLARHGAGGHFSLESFMGCGFGVCLSCVVPLRDGDGKDAAYARICVDGPTFPAGRVDWQRGGALL